MGEVSGRNFGLVIAYLVPGFIVVLGTTFFSPLVRGWLMSDAGTQPTVGGFLFITLASVAAGMVASAVRWAVVDSLHHATGVKEPRWDFRELQENLSAYTLLVEFHYRYYQFYSNTLIAIALAYGSHILAECGWCGGPRWVDLGFVIVEAVLFAASRDTLRKYYARASQTLRG